MGVVLEYDPKNVTCVLGGKQAHGFSDGEAIKLERNEQAYNQKVGVDGEGTRAKNNNKSGKITITLMQSSGYNDVLSNFAVADETADLGVVPFLLQDNSGRTLATALSCWVQKIPDTTFAKEVGERVWVLETDELNIFVGGN